MFYVIQLAVNVVVVVFVVVAIAAFTFSSLLCSALFIAFIVVVVVAAYKGLPRFACVSSHSTGAWASAPVTNPQFPIPIPILFPQTGPKLQFVLQFFIDESSIPSVAYKVGFLNLTSRVCQTVGYPVSNLDKLLEARTRL